MHERFVGIIIILGIVAMLLLYDMLATIIRIYLTNSILVYDRKHNEDDIICTNDSFLVC
jgi:hypothetical protein